MAGYVGSLYELPEVKLAFFFPFTAFFKSFFDSIPVHALVCATFYQWMSFITVYIVAKVVRVKFYLLVFVFELFLVRN